VVNDGRHTVIYVDGDTRIVSRALRPVQFLSAV
jgi:hypothetical protein